MDKTPSKKKAFIVQVLCILAALALGFLGVITGINGIRDSREYKKSADVRRVTAYVKETEFRGDADDEEYRVTLSYEVDGKQYTGRETYYHEIYKGEKTTIEVYLTPKGDYKIAPDVDPISFLFKCVCIFLGIVMFIGVAGMLMNLFGNGKDETDGKGRDEEEEA